MKTLNWLSRRSFHILILLISILSFMISSCGVTPINIESEIDALKQADKDWAEACAFKNADSIIAFYDDKAYHIDQHGNIHRGKEVLRKLWADELSKADYSMTWQFSEAYVAQAGDIGYMAGSYDLTITSQDGKKRKYNGSYLTIWKKQSDGSWKVLVDS